MMHGRSISQSPTGIPLSRALPVWLLLFVGWVGIGLTVPAEATPPRAEVRVYAHTFDHRPAHEALAEIRPLLSDSGTVEVQPGGNTLVVRDAPETLERIEELLTAFDRPPEDLRFDIQIVRAGPSNGISPPMPPENALPTEVVERLRELLRYEQYQVLAQAGVTSSEGQEVTYSLGQSYSVSFRLGAVQVEGEGSERLRLEDFRIFQNASPNPNKGRQLEPKELFRATLNLWVDRPFNLVLPQSSEGNEALMVAISCYREAETEDGGAP